jgi:hypothetical protein
MLRSLNNIVKDIPINISSSELSDIINLVLCVIVEIPVNDTIEVGDWVINKIEDKTFYLTKKYSSSDMSRFLHDEFCKRKMVKKQDRL